MNREQMIAWLTIEGWESVVCRDGTPYARHPSTRRFMHIGAYDLANHNYADGSQIHGHEVTGWKEWRSYDLTRLMRVVSE